MTAVAWPTIITAVHALADAALPNARVIRGSDITAESGSVVMIGVTTLDENSPDSPGSFTQEFQTFDGPRLETGTVNGLVMAWNGDSEQDTATADACDLFASVAAAVKADTTLGVTAFDYTVAQIQGGEIQEQQTDDGAVATVAFTVSYQSRLT